MLLAVIVWILRDQGSRDLLRIVNHVCSVLLVELLGHLGDLKGFNLKVLPDSREGVRLLAFHLSNNFAWDYQLLGLVIALFL